jgi:hypothetical protein
VTPRTLISLGSTMRNMSASSSALAPPREWPTTTTLLAPLVSMRRFVSARTCEAVSSCASRKPWCTVTAGAPGKCSLSSPVGRKLRSVRTERLYWMKCKFKKYVMEHACTDTLKGSVPWCPTTTELSGGLYPTKTSYIIVNVWNDYSSYLKDVQNWISLPSPPEIVGWNSG